MAYSTTTPIRARTIDEIIAGYTNGRPLAEFDRFDRMRLYRSARATQEYEKRCIALKENQNPTNTGGPHVNG